MEENLINTRENFLQTGQMKSADGTSRGSLVSLSFQPRSSLHGCLCFSLSHRRHSQSCSYHDYALHCSHERGMAIKNAMTTGIEEVIWYEGTIGEI